MATPPSSGMPENRLIEVKDGTTTVATYQYDYLGRRIQKSVGVSPAVTTQYIYDGWNIITEYTGGSLKKSYTWGMDLSGSMQGAGGVGGLLAVTDSTATYYPTYDGNGNVSEYLDSSSVVQAHYEYDAFGNTTVSSGAKVSDFAHRFSTKPHDSKTGLYYYGYRYYDLVTGRWPSRDPIEERGGGNLYGFIGNDGVNRWDLLGLFFGGSWYTAATDGSWFLGADARADKLAWILGKHLAAGSLTKKAMDIADGTDPTGHWILNSSETSTVKDAIGSAKLKFIGSVEVTHGVGMVCLDVDAKVRLKDVYSFSKYYKSHIDSMRPTGVGVRLEKHGWIKSFHTTTSWKLKRAYAYPR